MTTFNAILLSIILLFILLGFIAVIIRIATSVKTSKTGLKGLKITEKAWLFQYDFSRTCVIFSTTKAGAIKKFYRDYGKYCEIDKIMELKL